MLVRDLAEADASCGGKAANLAKLIAAGADVPPGFAIATGAFEQVVGRLDPNIDEIGHALAEAALRIREHSLDPAFVRDVEARARQLGPLLAVRSSATIEDGEGGAAAGVYQSRGAVPIGELWDAIRAVWTSALTPLAASYARQRKSSVAIGVVVQRFIPGELITVYTRPPGQPTSTDAIVQRALRMTRVPVRDGEPASPNANELVALARAAEAAIGALTTGADVEIIEHEVPRDDHDHRAPPASPWSVVQARPIVHPSARRRATVPPSLVAPLVADGRVWTWDVAHNPDPLSIAQRELVDRVERAHVAPFSLRVCAGYLYTTPLQRPPSRLDDFAADTARLEATLAAILDENQPLAGDDYPTGTTKEITQPVGVGLAILEAAIARFLAFYKVWAGELSPLIADARRLLPDALAARGVDDAEATAARMVGRRRSAIDAMLVDVALGVIDEATLTERLGVMAPAWDVHVPTFAERPALVREAIERARLVTPPAPAPPLALEQDLGKELAIARLAAELAERDDLWFARAQWLVRRALLERARAAGLPDADIFWLPFDAPLDDLDDARRRAAGARAAAERAAKWDMPIVVNGPPAAQRTSLHGVGTGPRVRGSVVRFASLASAITVNRGDVIVVRAVTPALAVLVVGCAALVSETGGLLDHGAALARELGIPCVVGCHDAWSVLTDGMLVTVHGDAGTVST